MMLTVGTGLENGTGLKVGTGLRTGTGLKWFGGVGAGVNPSTPIDLEDTLGQTINDTTGTGLKTTS